MNWFKGSFTMKRKKVNPLQTEKEKAIEEIANTIREWSFFSDRKEILNTVCSRVFLEKRHIQRSPRPR